MISGTALISPLSGSLQLFLSTLSPSSDFRSYPLFAPLSHPLPTLTASPSSTTHTDVNAELEAAGVPIEMLEEGRIVFMLQDLRSGIEAIDGGALQGMGKIWPEGKSAFGLNGCHPVSFHSPFLEPQKKKKKEKKTNKQEVSNPLRSELTRLVTICRSSDFDAARKTGLPLPRSSIMGNCTVGTSFAPPNSRRRRLRGRVVGGR